MDARTVAPALDSDLRLIPRTRQWVSWLGFAVAGLLFLIRLADIAMTPLYLVFGQGDLLAFGNVWVPAFGVLSGAFLVLSCLLVIGALLVWLGLSGASRRGPLLLLLGLALHWGWWKLSAVVDFFGLNGAMDVTPELTQRATASWVVSTAIDLVAIGLLVGGAIWVRRSPGPVRPGTAEPSF